MGRYTRLRGIGESAPMLMPMAHARWLTACVVFIYASMSVAEDAGLSSQLQGDGEGGVTFDEISVFLVNSNAAVQPGRSRRGCELICARAPTCKSYSYRAKDKTCVVSQDALTYDPDFVFNAKAEHSTTPNVYHTFEGLTYRTTGWLKSTGKKFDECKELCSKAASCKAFSYRKHDRTCMLSNSGIEYKADFSYYEKNTPKTVPRAATKSVGPVPTQAPVEKVVPPTEKPEVIKLEVKEKAEQKTASKIKDKVEKVVKENNDKAKAIDERKTKAIEQEKQKAEGHLADVEEKFKKHTEEMMAKEKNRAKIRFANKELTTKNEERAKQMKEDEEQGQKNISEIKKKAKDKVRNAKKEAMRMASVEGRKLALAASLKKAQAEINDAAVSEAEAKKTREKERTRAAVLREREAKSEQAIHSEIDQKKTIAGASREVDLKRSMKEAKMAV